jgi:peptide/nickel transport system permease protein
MSSYIIRRFMQSFLTVLVILITMWSVRVYLGAYPQSRYYESLSERVAQLTKSMDELPIEQRADTGSRYNRMRVEREQLLIEKRDREQLYSLDKPWPLSFLAWVYDPADTSYYDPIQHKDVPYGVDFWVGPLHITGSGLVTGDWGAARGFYSRYQASVGTNTANTLLLLVLTLFLSVLIALPVGVLGAVKHDTKTDHAVTFFTTTGLSTPPFVMGFVLILLLGIIPYQLHNNNGWTWLPYLPVGGGHSIDKDGDFYDYIYHMVLPLATMVLVVAPGFSRYVRSSMLDVLSKDYIRTARAKGTRPYRVYFGHALRNAGLPLITAIGLTTPFIITALGIVEYVFAYPGIGAYFSIYIIKGGASAVGVQAATLAVATISLLNMLADITYTVIDPRVSYNKL